MSRLLASEVPSTTRPRPGTSDALRCQISRSNAFVHQVLYVHLSRRVGRFTALIQSTKITTRAQDALADPGASSDAGSLGSLRTPPRSRNRSIAPYDHNGTSSNTPFVYHQFISGYASVSHVSVTSASWASYSLFVLWKPISESKQASDKHHVGVGSRTTNQRRSRSTSG